MTLKYNQNHSKWYELLTLNKYYHHEKFDISHIYSVWEKCNVKVFATYTHSVGWPNTDHYIDSHFSCESKNNNNKKTTTDTAVFTKDRKNIKSSPLKNIPKTDSFEWCHTWWGHCGRKMLQPFWAILCCHRPQGLKQRPNRKENKGTQFCTAVKKNTQKRSKL